MKNFQNNSLMVLCVKKECSDYSCDKLAPQQHNSSVYVSFLLTSAINVKTCHCQQMPQLYNHFLQPALIQSQNFNYKIILISQLRLLQPKCNDVNQNNTDKLVYMKLNEQACWWFYFKCMTSKFKDLRQVPTILIDRILFTEQISYIHQTGRDS